MAVMGRNLALNIADRGFRVAVWNRDAVLTEEAVAESGGTLAGAETLEELVASLEKPRKLLMMIKAGKPVDQVLEQLRGLLERDDIIIDGGNSWFEDTQRREQEMATVGLHFLGIGVSGGESGARHGPSLMPGGKRDAYSHLEPMLQAISAKTVSGPCVTYVGTDGAGHFVKMVHNGIEYADMQLIAEAYQMLREINGVEPPELAELFMKWNQGVLESFLIDITAQVFQVKDEKTGSWLVNKVLDRAEQKGTGRWAAEIALRLGIPVPSIAAAIDGRVLSNMRDLRLKASTCLRGPYLAATDSVKVDEDGVQTALYASKICAYAQGMALIQAASNKYHWSVDLKEIARIWKGGCIIRARFLDTMMQAFERKSDLPNLLMDEQIGNEMAKAQTAWRRTVCRANAAGVPVPGLSASLSYYDTLRAPTLPHNLVQAQRDAFGAHLYQRIDDLDAPPVHKHN
jgi:6-phosphogluconate dehydrogenase